MNNSFIILILLMVYSCSDTNKIEILKGKEKKLEMELDSLHSICQDIKYASHLDIDINDTIIYDENSEKYLEYQYSALYFEKFFYMSFVNNHPKAYNDVCRIHINFYGEKLFLKQFERVYYYCLYNLAKATELGYKNTQNQFDFLKITKQNLQNSKYYFFKAFK
jgi:hypothetical protein